MRLTTRRTAAIGMATLGFVGLTLAFQTAVGSGAVGIGVIGGGSCQGDGAIAISYGLDGLDLRSVTASGFGHRGDVVTNIESAAVEDLTSAHLVIADCHPSSPP